MNEQETHAEVIAEMRGARTEFPFVYLMGEPDTPEIVDVTTKKIIEPRKINIRRVTVKELADRLESAHNRERGNCAKLREALTKVKEWMELRIVTCGFEASATFPTMLEDVVLPALAAPPRNCDVGTAEEQDERFSAHCNRYFNEVGLCGKDCPGRDFNMLGGTCSLLWAQMPYVEKEGCIK